MVFRTSVTLPAFNFSINHSDKIMMLGSCFAENLSAPLLNAGFRVDVNPFGIVYNPQSLASCMREVISSKKYTSNDLFFHKEGYHSFSHHSKFSADTVENCLETINMRLESASDFLKNATILIITFGTSYVYLLKSTGETVVNCHKLPESCFIRKRLSIEDIVDDWDSLINDLIEYNPNLKILFTVSPIRHWKDGAHGNQLSKSILLLAIDELVRKNAFCSYYFPSYEILLDELRDYRFYAEDMLHPSLITINYIWEKFSDVFFMPETKLKIKEWQNIQKALNHKPFNSNSEDYKSFLLKTEQKLNNFINKNLI